MSQWVSIAGVLKINPYIGGEYELRKTIENIMGQEWDSGMPKNKIPATENDKLPKGTEGSLKYRIESSWYREYDDNGLQIEKHLTHLAIVFYGDLRDRDGSGLKEWFQGVIDKIGKLPVEIRSGVLTYNDYSGFTTALVVMPEQEKNTDMLIKWNYRLEEIKIKGENNELGL